MCTSVRNCMCHYLPDIYGNYTKKILLIIVITAISVSIVLTFKFHNLSLNLLTRIEVVGNHKPLNHRVIQVIIRYNKFQYSIIYYYEYSDIFDIEVPFYYYYIIYTNTHDCLLRPLLCMVMLNLLVTIFRKLLFLFSLKSCSIVIIPISYNASKQLHVYFMLVVIEAIGLIYLRHKFMCILMRNVFNIVVAARVNRKTLKLAIILIYNFYVGVITGMSYDIISTRLVYSNINNKITKNIGHLLHCMQHELQCKNLFLLLYGTQLFNMQVYNMNVWSTYVIYKYLFSIVYMYYYCLCICIFNYLTFLRPCTVYYIVLMLSSNITTHDGS